MEDCLPCPSGLYTPSALLTRTIIVKETGRTPLRQSVGSFRRKTFFHRVLRPSKFNEPYEIWQGTSDQMRFVSEAPRLPRPWFDSWTRVVTFRPAGPSGVSHIAARKAFLAPAS